MTYNRYNALVSALDTINNRNSVAAVHRLSDLSGELEWGVHIYNTPTLIMKAANAYDYSDCIADAADIAAVLNDMALVYEDKADSDIERLWAQHKNEEARRVYEDIIDRIVAAIEGKSWEWLETILTA